MKEIYIIRHAAAAELDNEIAEESYRYLSIHGRNHCKVVAQRLKDMEVQFDIILTSPLVRSVQTAEVFAAVLKYGGEIKTAIELIGGNSYTRFLQMLKRHEYSKSIAVFGHAPDVNNFCNNQIKNHDIKDQTRNYKNTNECKKRRKEDWFGI